MRIRFIGLLLFLLGIKYKKVVNILCIGVLLFFYSNIAIGQGEHIVPLKGDIDAEGFYENAPTISLDGKTLIYVSDKLGSKKLFESKKVNNRWSEGKSIEKINNYGFSKSFISEPSLTYDGNTLYFCANYNENMDIYYSKRVNGEWSEPINIGEPINTKGYEGSPFISADNKTLYFVKDKSGETSSDYDCKNLYFAKIHDNGKWGTPKMMPFPINLQCEKSPRICADNKTLYYCSFRGDKKAFFNLYRSKIIADKIWSEPEYMEFASTEKRDQFPCVTAYGDSIYFNISLPLKNETYGGIFKAEIPKRFKPENTIIVKGKVLDLYTKKPISANINVFDARTRESVYSMTNNSIDGTFLFTLAQDRNYKVEFTGEGYSYHYLLFNVDKIKKMQEVNQNIFLYKDAKLSLNVFDNQLFDALDAKVNVLNSQNEILDIEINKINKGRYELFIPVGDNYKIEIQKKCYANKVITINLTMPQFKDFERNIELEPKQSDFLIDLKEELTGRDINAEIQLSNKNRDETITITSEMIKNGQYTALLRKCDEYEILVNAEGYNYFSSSFDMSDQQFYNQETGEDNMTQNANRKIEVKLEKIEEGTSIEIKNILFEYNSFELLSQSYKELNKVVKFMNVNKKINVEISAHTDDLGSDYYNMKLSEKRAQSVVNYLLKKEVSESRIIAKGYGESNPLVPNNSEENRAKNRRVELKILKMN